MEVPHFEDEFRHFSEVVYPRFGDSRFTSFRDGAARGWESYKPKLRERALAILDAASWRLEMVGTGEILNRTIAAIEISGNDQTRNNLVSWEGRYGPASAGHAPLLTARENPKRRAAFERWLWDAFRSQTPPDILFERFRELAGNGYPLAAYLFFLIDIDRFGPIAPMTFDEAFRRLGIPLATSGRCSWENYAAFNEAIEAVRKLLINKPGLADAKHIDAHSFLWMMVRMEEEPNGSTSPSAVRFAGARARTIFNMAQKAIAAVNQSGHIALHVYKEKQLHHQRQELEKIIDDIIKKQRGLCALTDLPLQWEETSEDPAMIASLDRIDSEGHYSSENLQVVCRFVNQWKSNSADGEFRRLLAVVRASVHLPASRA